MARKTETHKESQKSATVLIDISKDADLSGAYRVPRGHVICGITTPSNFDGTDMKIHVSDSMDGTFVEVADPAAATATDYTLTTAASKYKPVDPNVTAGIEYYKIETVTDQSTSDTSLTVHYAPL